MNVANLKACAFTTQTARTECGKSAFVRQFAQRIMLIHKLRELRTSEKFFYRRNDGTNIYQELRSNNFGILNGHTLANDAFHSCHTDSELILQEFAHTANAPISQMIYIVRVSNAAH